MNQKIIFFLMPELLCWQTGILAMHPTSVFWYHLFVKVTTFGKYHWKPIENSLQRQNFLSVHTCHRLMEEVKTQGLYFFGRSVFWKIPQSGFFLYQDQN